MSPAKLLRFFAVLGALLLGAYQPARGYDLIRYNSQPVTWWPGSVTMQLKFDTSRLLQDGTNFASSAIAAMDTWNAVLGKVQFTARILPVSAGNDGDDVHEMLFANDIYGQAFGSSTLAVTTVFYSTTQRSDSTYPRVEADILFNTAYNWDSYRGVLQGAEEFRRVTVHELGHALGLDHPDQATPPQSVSAIMNHTVSNREVLAQDDISGAQFLYGAAGTLTRPVNDNFANANAIALAAGTSQVTGTNQWATKEHFEPDHVPGQTGGSSLWWKWTAPSAGSLVVDTNGSNFDTLLAAYTGTGVSALTQLASNDDIEPYDGTANPNRNRQSRVTFNVAAGTTYFIGVDGWDAEMGNVTVNLAFTPTNTDVAPAIVSHPANQSVTVGQAAQFTVAANGLPAPSYVWQRSPSGAGSWTDLSDGGSYSGTRTATLNVSATTSLMSGDQFRCVATNAAGSATSNAAILTVIVPNSAPTASFSLSAERAVGQTLTITLTVGDADNNFYYANLWVTTPTRGQLALRTDNTLVASTTLTPSYAVTSTAGTHTRSFTFTPTDGAGSYTFALAAVDTVGARTDAPSQTITVNPPAPATFSLPVTQKDLVVVAGVNHLPVRLPVTRNAGVPSSGFTVSSNVAWVTPAFDSDTSELVLNFATTGLVAATNDAMVRLMRGDETVILTVRAAVSVANIVKLVDDPLRSRTYGVHQNGLNAGALVVFDPLNGTYVGSLTLDLKPAGMAIRADGSELLALCSVSKSIVAVDLNKLAVSEVIALPAYDDWGSSSTWGDVQYGPGGVIYYSDGTWAPILRVLNRSTRTVLQTMLLDGGSPDNSGRYGFGDFAVSSDQTALYAWGQYGWSAGITNSTVAKIVISPNGQLGTSTTMTGYNSLSRDPLNTPVLLASNGDIFIKQLRFTDSSVTTPAQSFSSNIFAISPGGEIAASSANIYEVATGNVLYALSGSPTVQAITSDYARLVYFDTTTRQLRTLDLFAAIGATIMGRNLSPADGSVVLPPTKLQWTPQPGVDRYRVYLGTSSSAVASASTSSPEYLGETATSSFTLPGALTPGSVYYWRIDPVNSAGSTTGTVFSFRVATIAASQPKIDTATVRGHSRHRVSIDLSSAVAGKSWTLSSTTPWITFPVSTGTTPSTVEINLDASALSAGVSQGSVTVTASDGAFAIPVKLTVDPLALTAMRSAPGSTKVYALSEDTSLSSSLSRAYLLEIDTVLKRIERVVRVGNNATDLAVHLGDNRIYVANWQSGSLLAVDRTSFALARTYAFKPSQGTGYTQGDVYRLAPGVAGRLIVSGQDQWITARILDTVTGSVLATTTNASLYSGRGAYDPAGRYYYHGDNGYTGAVLHKFDTAGDQFSAHVSTGVSGSGYYGASDLIISENGNRLFWNSVALKPDLTPEWSIGAGIVSTSADGRYAFSSSTIYDIERRSVVGTLPVTATVSAFNAAMATLVYQNGTGLGFYTLSAAAPSRTPADGAIVSSATVLRWAAIPGVTAYRIYLGTIQADVAAAGQASPLYLGQVTTNEFTLPSALASNQNYYWRLDVVLGTEIATGVVQTFRVSNLVPSLTRIDGMTVQGNPNYDFDVRLTTPTAGQAWSASTSAAWIRLTPSSGTTPATLRVSIDSTSLPAGQNQSTITLTGAGSTLSLPVSVLVDPLALTILKNDPSSAMVYGISEQSGQTSGRAYLLEIDAQTERILRTVPVGSGVTDLAVHGPENRLYVTNWREGKLLALDRQSLELLRTYPFKPFTSVGYGDGDAYRVAAGVSGRVVVEEYDQWVDISLYDTNTATTLRKGYVREGGGQFEPTGRYYYHGENNSSGAALLKFDTAGDVFSQLASKRVEHLFYGGSRTVVVSGDGSRIFWAGGVFDPSLTVVWAAPAEIFSTNTNGRYAFGESRIFDTTTQTTAYLMPVTTKVSAFNDQSGKLVVQNGATMAFYALANLPAFAPPTIQTQPVSRSVFAGIKVTFSVVAAPSAGATYRWQRLPVGSITWSDISIYDANYTGASTSSLEVVSATKTTNNGDKFRCIVTNLAGSVTSAEATLTVVATGGAIQVAHGYHHTAYLRLDGPVWNAGRNQEGQLGDNTFATRGTLGFSQIGAAALTSGADHLLYLQSDGKLWASGYNEFGTLGTGNTTNSGVPVQVATDVAAAVGGYRHTLIRKTDGTLWGTGRNNEGQLGLGDQVQRNSFVQIGTGVATASAGLFHSLYVTSDGRAYGMGGNDNGQLGLGNTTSSTTPKLIGTGFIAVTAGYYHSLFLKADRTLWAAGLNNYGQLGDGTNITRTAPVQVASNVVAMAAGFYHSVFLKSDGTVWTMGRNESGELADGTFTSRSTPQQIASDVIEISSGVHSIGLIKNGGGVWVAGLNNQGQLADGTTTDRSTLYAQYVGGGGGLPASVATSATNSDTADRVRITWPHSLRASHYRVWRSVSADPATAEIIAARVVGSYHEDLSGTPGLTYHYWVQPVNAYGALPLSTAAMGRQGASGIAPTITTEPATKTAGIGESVTFTVVAGGTAPLTYQWRKDQQPLAGANAASYTIASAQQTDSGNYDVVVSSPYGAVTSRVATLTVKLAQTITFNPIPDLAYSLRGRLIGATASSGLPVTLTVESGPMTISNTLLTFLGVGPVTVRATQAGNADYAPAPDVVRSFNVTPPVNDLFADAILIVGGSVTTYGTNKFCSNESSEPVHVAGQSGGASIWWKWKAPYGADVVITTNGSDFDTQLAVYSGTTLPGLTPLVANDDVASGSVNTSSVRFLATAGTEYYIAIDGHGGATGAVQLNLVGTPSNGGAPAITTQPGDITVSVGQTATLNLGYIGAPPVVLYWERLPAGSATWALFSMALPYSFQPTAAMNGDQFRCTASNSYGSVTSNVVLLTVNKLAQSITFTGPADLTFSSTPLQLSATASSGLSVSFSVVSGPARISGSQLTLTGAGTVTLRASQAGDATYAAAPDVERSFVVRETVNSWQLGYFSESELLDPAISGPNADPDHDGMPNLVEYALGLDPRAASSTSAPPVGVTATDWTFTYSRPADRSDITYAVEYSVDLTHWVSVGAEHRKISTANGVETWTATQPLTLSPSCYFRLVVTRTGAVAP